MKRNILLSLAFVSSALLVAPDVSAGLVPAREVRINAERLARLPAADQQRVLEIKDRLETMLATDRSTLDPAQRAELRGEWKDLKAEMKEYNSRGSTIYISTAALIIIILLLILIF